MASTISSWVSPLRRPRVEVERQLFGVAADDECGDRDEAAIARAQLRPFPDVAEEDVVGEVGELVGEAAEHPPGGGGFMRCHDAVLSAGGVPRNSASVMCSFHVVVVAGSSPASNIAMCSMKQPGAAACQ